MKTTNQLIDIIRAGGGIRIDASTKQLTNLLILLGLHLTKWFI